MVDVIIEASVSFSFWNRGMFSGVENQNDTQSITWIIYDSADI